MKLKLISYIAFAVIVSALIVDQRFTSSQREEMDMEELEALSGIEVNEEELRDECCKENREKECSIWVSDGQGHSENLIFKGYEAKSAYEQD